MVKPVARPADFIVPDWPAPANVRALSTSRGLPAGDIVSAGQAISAGGAAAFGYSAAPYQAFNLGNHVGDDPARVSANRQLLADVAGLTAAPLYLTQVHGIVVADCQQTHTGEVVADAAVCRGVGPAALVMTADCLPVLFCDEDGTQVAAAHAGWRGLCDGVLEATLAHFASPAKVLAWLGPAIGPQHFEVGAEVRAAFVGKQAAAESCFVPTAATGKYLADIYQLARLRLQAAGVYAIYGGDTCTYANPQQFFSYRRDGQTGRQASLIWLSGTE